MPRKRCAFALFTQDKMPECSETDPKKRMKEIAQAWKNATEDVQNKYKDQANKEKELQKEKARFWFSKFGVALRSQLQR